MTHPDRTRRLDALPPEVPPARDLWPAIAASLPAGTPLRRSARWRPWALAAGLALIVAGGAWLQRQGAFGRVEPEVAALDAADPALAAERRRLIARLPAMLDALPLDARVGAQQSLAAVRGARTEILAALRRDARDPVLRDWLRDNREQEVQVLRSMLPAAAPPAAAAPHFARQGAADAAGEVAVFNASGEVEVTTWDLPEYRLEAQNDDGIARVDVIEAPARLTVRVVPKDAAAADARKAKLQLRIPVGSTLAVVTSDAHIAVYGLSGPANLQSASGLVELVAARGPAALRSVSGAVRFAGTGVPSTLRAESLAGRIDVLNAAGSLEALAATGAVHVDAVLVDRIHVQAIQGRAEVAARLSPQADVQIESFGGAVQARLVAEAGYRYDVGTHGGAFLTCFGRGDAGIGQGQVGAGVASVRLRSFGGQVRLCDS